MSIFGLFLLRNEQRKYLHEATDALEGKAGAHVLHIQANAHSGGDGLPSAAHSLR